MAIQTTTSKSKLNSSIQPILTVVECNQLRPALISVALELLSRLTDTTTCFHSCTYTEIINLMTDWLNGLAIVDADHQQQATQFNVNNRKMKNNDPYSVYPVWWWGEQPADFQQPKRNQSISRATLQPMTVDKLIEKWHDHPVRSLDRNSFVETTTSTPTTSALRPHSSTKRSSIAPRTQPYFIPIEPNRPPPQTPKTHKPGVPPITHLQPSRIPKPTSRPLSKPLCTSNVRVPQQPKQSTNVHEIIDIAKCAFDYDDFLHAFSSSDDDDSVDQSPSSSRLSHPGLHGTGGLGNDWYKQQWAERDMAG